MGLKHIRHNLESSLHVDRRTVIEIRGDIQVPSPNLSLILLIFVIQKVFRSQLGSTWVDGMLRS